MQFADYNMLATIGAFGFGLSQLIFLAAGDQVHSRRRTEGRGEPVAGSEWPGVDAAFAGAFPYLRDAAGHQVTQSAYTEGIK
jgi:hypothetical protein